MKTNKLGKSGLEVSAYCLGTMTFGEQTGEADAHKQIDMALDAGINFIDTAELYPTIPLRAETAGNTEKIIGSWLEKNKEKRKDVIIASKVVGKGYEAIRNGDPINPAGMRQALDKSLISLNTDVIDLYQLHWPNRGSYHFRQIWGYNCDNHVKTEILDDMEKLVETLYNFKREGKIRAIGLSNETCWGTMQFVNICSKYDELCIASIQNEYSLLCRLHDTDMSELSKNEDIPLLAYSPLAGGLLSGKYLNNNKPQDSRLSRTPTIFGRVNERSSQAVQSYVELARKNQIDPVHMALSFCKQRAFMGSVIFGASTSDQLKTILAGVDVELKDDILKEIDDINRNNPMTF